MNIAELLDTLEHLREKLTSEVTKDKAIMEALKAELVRLNFPAPPGFYSRLFKNH